VDNYLPQQLLLNLGMELAGLKLHDLNIALRNRGGTGASNTAALQYGGGPTKTTATSIWNGTTWINDQDLNASKRRYAEVLEQTILQH
jgi:hypothetical protein